MAHRYSKRNEQCSRSKPANGSNKQDNEKKTATCSTNQLPQKYDDNPNRQAYRKVKIPQFYLEIIKKNWLAYKLLIDRRSH